MTLRSFIAYASLAIMALLIGSSVGFVLYSAWDLPEVQALEHFKPSITTRVYSDSSEHPGRVLRREPHACAVGRCAGRVLEGAHRH